MTSTRKMKPNPHRVPVEQSSSVNPRGRSIRLPHLLDRSSRQRQNWGSLGTLKIQRVEGAGIKMREEATHTLP